MIMKQLNKEYMNEYNNGNTENPAPSIWDYVDKIKQMKGKSYSERTLLDIKKAGDL